MFEPVEKGVTIRQPSTANLMLDSADRSSGNAANFSIQRNNSILNGFFTRIGTTEVVLEWNTSNISADLANNFITVDLSGSVSGNPAGATLVAPTGFYNQAELLDWLVIQLNDLSGGVTPSPHWSIQATNNGYYALGPSADVYAEFSGPIADALGLTNGSLQEFGPTALVEAILLPDADLRPFRYLDFISPQLTYNQDLKDNTTSTFARDVLCRWYFAWDEAPPLDKYGFPILMGYTAFSARRTFSPPKQIRWDPAQPVGNITFQVYSNLNTIASLSFNTNWLMTLQVSEV